MGHSRAARPSSSHRTREQAGRRDGARRPLARADGLGRDERSAEGLRVPDAPAGRRWRRLVERRAKYYDRCLPSSFKSQLYVHNAATTSSTGAGSTTTTAVRCRRCPAPTTSGARDLRLRVLPQGAGGHDTIGFLVGTELPPATQTSLVHLAFKWKSANTVDDHEQANTIARELAHPAHRADRPRRR